MLITDHFLHSGKMVTETRNRQHSKGKITSPQRYITNQDSRLEKDKYRFLTNTTIPL